jgi:Protein of unknown function (DUF3892)
MDEFHVNCVTKPNRLSPHAHITHIGNTNENWRLTREEAINRIEGRLQAFFTVDPSSGARAYVGVVREPGKSPYLRTYADGKWNDNLLAMTECGANCQVLA